MNDNFEEWFFKLCINLVKRQPFAYGSYMSAKQIRQSIDLLKDSSSAVDFSLESIQCAYFFEFSVSQAVVAAFHFERLVELNDVKKFISKGYLKICCLGGGPGMEAIAICKTIYDSMGDNFRNKPLEMYVSIIDSDEGWRESIINTSNVLGESKESFDSDKMNLHFSFYRDDLYEPLNPYVLKAIRKSQILILAARPLSKLIHSEMTLKPLLQKIVNVMEYGSLISAIDFTEGSFYDVLENTIAEIPSCKTCLLRLDSSHDVDLIDLNDHLCLYSSHWKESLGEKTIRVVSGVYKKVF